MKLIDLVEKLGSDKKKLILVLIVFVVVVYLDVAFIMGMQLSAIKGASERIAKLKTDTNNLMRDLAKMQKQDSSQQNPLKIQKIITEEELPALLQEIDSIASKNKVSIQQIKPSKEAKAKEDKAGTKQKKQDAIMIAVDISGDYHHIGAFINDLETAEELISVEELKIAQSPGDYLQQKANILLKTYVKK